MNTDKIPRAPDDPPTAPAPSIRKKESFLSSFLYLLFLATHLLFSGPDATASLTPKDTAGPAAAQFAPALPATPTVAEARQMVIAYMTRMATREWVCRTTMDYSKVKSYTKTLIYEPGATYFGLPYVSHHNGVELFGKYLDANKVYTGPITFAACRGVTCASAVKVAYRTVSPDVSFTGTPNILPHARMGTVAVGDYQWEAATPPDATLTQDIIRNSTTNAILEAYALLQPADAIASRWDTGSAINGHARLISSKPAVVRGDDGKINPRKSCLHVIEQCATFENVAGGGQTTWRINKKYTFAELIGKYYVPITLAEFETGKLADAAINVTGLEQPETIVSSNAVQCAIASNFLINEVDAQLYRADGSLAAQIKHYPENTRCRLTGIPFDHDVTRLPHGDYRFVLTIKIGYGDYVYTDRTFTR